MNVVDNELDLELYSEDQERGWIGLCMKGWRRLTEVGQAELVVLVALWKVQVRRFKAFFFLLTQNFLLHLSQEHRTRRTPPTHGSMTSLQDLILSMKLKIIIAAAEALQRGLGVIIITTWIWIRDIIKRETILALDCMRQFEYLLSAWRA